MAKKYDIGIRQKQKKKKNPSLSLTIKTIFSILCFIISAIGILYLFLNRNSVLVNETLDIVFFKLKFTPTVILIICGVMILIMIISLYLSILALLEQIRRMKHPSDLDRQIELIESQFAEQEKKVFISSKEKLKQLEQQEKEHQELLRKKYGDNDNTY